jgi:hypothetical protein
MGTNRHTVPNALILSATILLTSSIACAAQSAAQTVSTQGEAIVTVASNTDKTDNAMGSVEPASFPSSETGVRKAAAEGPESLRRYVQRTRRIYNYYYWNFAKEQ